MALDKAHDKTDKILAMTDKELVKLYSKNFNELKKDIKSVLDKIQFKNDMTPLERYQASLKYDRLIKLEKELAITLSNTAKQGVAIINNSMKQIYKENYNQEIDNLSVLLAITIPNKYNKAKNVSESIDEAKSPFDTLAVDEAKSTTDLRRNITRQFTQGIMQGENPDTIIKRFKNILELKLHDLTRIARTETTRIENKGRIDAYKVGEDLGYKMVKEWVAKGDNRTRDAHKQADGQIVDFDKPFNVGGEKLMYPGDPNGSAKNVINCRCTMRAGIKREKA